MVVLARFNGGPRMRSGDLGINGGDERNVAVGSIEGIDLSPQARSLWAKPVVAKKATCGRPFMSTWQTPPS